MKLKSGMWNADVDFDLAAFHSLVRLATCRNPALWFFMVFWAKFFEVQGYENWNGR